MVGSSKRGHTPSENHHFAFHWSKDFPDGIIFPLSALVVHAYQQLSEEAKDNQQVEESAQQTSAAVFALAMRPLMMLHLYLTNPEAFCGYKCGNIAVHLSVEFQSLY